MFKKFGQIVYAIRWGILAAGVLLLVAGVLYGTGVFSRLKDGGFEDTSTQSFHAGQQLQRSLHISAADIVLLFHSDSLKAEDPRYASAVAETLGRLSGQANIDRIVSFYVTAAPSFVSNDGHDTYAIVTMTGTDDAKLKRYQELKPLLTSSVLQVRFGGVLPASAAISSQVSKDLGRAESITFPVTAVLLIIIFGGLVAASLPLAIGGLAILGAFITLRLLSNFTDISIFALNVVTMLGLGLAIDYSLFIVSRFREELPGHSAEAAVIRTLATAGRTVAFSAITVALSLASLLIFPQMFLRPMGLGGIAAVMVAMLGSLTVLPALLAVLGPRVDSLAVRRFLPFAARAGEGSEHQGIWYRIAQQVMRRPGIIAAVLVVALASAGIPFLGARFSTPDARALPAGNEARQVSAALVRDFPRDESSAVRVAVQTSGPALSGENIGALYDYTLRLRLLAHVKGIEGLTTVGPQLDRAGYQAEYSQPNANPQQAAAVAAFAQGNLTEVSVFSDVPSQSSAGQSLVKAIRALPPPTGARVEVAGESASLVDLLHSLTLHIPAALALIVVTIFVLLFLAFGSVVVPLKAVLLNFLSLTATFGALVWVFQEGHLQGLLGFQSLGSLDATQPVLIFAIAFGLSMDYEVFLLSRIKERYDQTGDNTLAISSGLQRTGTTITSAAALLAVVFLAFTTSELVFIKEVGFGLALAVFMDATVVRSLLVPATTRLMGRLNWWAPTPLTWIWERAGLGEVEVPLALARNRVAGND